MIKRILSIFMLWLGCLTLWAQSTGGYGGDYNPTRPDDPAMPAARYSLTITATEGGTVSPDITNKKYTAGVGMWVRAYNQTGYKFLYWKKGDEKVSSTAEFYYYTQAEDVVLTAVFEYNPGQYGGDYKPALPDDPQTSAKSYNLTVECSPSNASSVSCSSSKPMMGSDVYVSTSLNSNYKFLGWWEEDELVSTEPRYYFKMGGRDMLLVAKYEYAPARPNDPTSDGSVTTRQLRYRIDGRDYHAENLVPGTRVKALEQTPIKRGYSFKGWSEIPEVMPDYDVTVNGTFAVNKYKVKFSIDGKSITKFLEYGAEIVPPDVWPAEGEVFKWIDMPATMPNRDIVINGEYTAVKYALIYILDGVEYRRKEYKKGEEIIPLQDPEKEGYVFSGWSDIPTTMPATYVVVNGSFIDPNQQRYQVTFKVDGEVHHVDSVTLGSNLSHLKTPAMEGYTYQITNDIPVFMPKYDLVIEGTFAINSHKLVYMIDGDVYKESVVEYGTPITEEIPPAIVGSAFTGWGDIPETMPDMDVTLSGSYILNGYTITYVVDGEVYEKNVFAYGKDVRPLGNLSKEGYTFSGWSEIPETMPNNDVTVVGSFIINKYKVTYMVNGSVYHTDTMSYSTPIVPIEEPVKEGYTFSGWGEIPGIVPSNDVIINGVFTVNKHKIVYTVDGSVSYSDSIEYGEKIILLDEPIKEGYTFSGWSETPRTMPDRNVFVNGTFSINEYKVIYLVDDNTYYTDTLEYGAGITVMKNPVKEGYTFSGWSEAPQIMPANDVTISGKFTINKYKLIYTVEGIQYYTDSLEYGAEIVEQEWPVKEGYTFSGWEGLPSTMPANNVVAEGVFHINKYKITYIVEGETLHTDSIAFNEKIVPFDYPEKEGFTFSGWIGIPTVMPANDITISGNFIINKYKLTYTVEGIQYYTDSLEYGAVIVEQEWPVKEGYTFSGWVDLPSAMPANNVVAEGVFHINKYKITYIVEGETLYTDSITFNERISPIDYPEKEGFTFSGWIGIPTVMPASDVTTGGEFFINTTQIDSQGLVYSLNESTEAFEVSNYEESLAGRIVIPEDLYGYPIKGIDSRAFMGAEELTTIVIPASITSIGSKAFYGCLNLQVIEWNTTAPLEEASFEEPERHNNLLIYVKDPTTKVTYKGNVVVDGVAEQITLYDGIPLCNTRDFTARSVKFTREFTKKTQIGVAGGWEALVLPFDVQTVTSETRGLLKPFGQADFDKSLPYWVAEFQSDGSFAYVETIKANTPFIMEVPNSDEYQDIYNVEGNITFSSENVTVHSTMNISEPTGNGYTLQGSYEGVSSDSRVYALNDVEYTLEDGSVSLAGSVFVADARDILPFEAYIYGNQVSRASYMRISGKNGTGLNAVVLDASDDSWYTLQGVRLNGRPQEKGLYIYKNQVVYVK